MDDDDAEKILALENQIQELRRKCGEKTNRMTGHLDGQRFQREDGLDPPQHDVMPPSLRQQVKQCCEEEISAVAQGLPRQSKTLLAELCS